jgi:hypothetical protein
MIDFTLIHVFYVTIVILNSEQGFWIIVIGRFDVGHVTFIHALMLKVLGDPLVVKAMSQNHPINVFGNKLLFRFAITEGDTVGFIVSIFFGSCDFTFDPFLVALLSLAWKVLD